MAFGRRAAMIRAAFVLLAVMSALFTTPLTAEAQTGEAVSRIVWLSARPGIHLGYTQAFLRALRELGWIVGQRITVEYRADEETERLASFATELVRLGVDVIVASGTPSALVAKEATSTIPIVMVQVADPVGYGLVASLARPGGNVTGIAHGLPLLAPRQVALLEETVPGVSRIGLLWDPTQPGHAPIFRRLQDVADETHVTLQSLEVRGPRDFERALSALRVRPPEALMVLASPLTVRHQFRLRQFVLRHRLPTMSNWPGLTEAGGLMSYTPDWQAMYRQAAGFVDKILKGVTPAELPVQQPARLGLTINLKTARALGLEIPPSVLVRADEIIE